MSRWLMTPADPISRALRDIRDTFASDDRGAVATYIPQLSAVDPGLFGIALASLEGRVYSAGDADQPFTIQSVSKPFVYALALADHGLEGVLSRVGAEPSGEAFNAISLEADTGRPANPMINAGAIVTTSLVEAAGPEARFARIRGCLAAFAGRDLAVDEAVYRSELETGDMNRALGYLMRNAGSLPADVDATLDVYFRQCAVLVTARDLAVMAATLANGGVNPVTGERAATAQICSHVLTIMGTCGMYDFSGEWLLRVGLPAKSGVAGGLIAAKPGQFGMGLFSPPLDAQGNSVRAVETCRNLADRFDLHLLHDQGPPPPALWLDGTSGDFASNADRGEADRTRLREHGAAIRVLGLQGELGFAAAERLLPTFAAMPDPAGARRWLILDLDRVGRLHNAAESLLRVIAAELDEAGVTVVVADPGARGYLDSIRAFVSLEAALDACADLLLASLPQA